MCPGRKYDSPRGWGRLKHPKGPRDDGTAGDSAPENGAQSAGPLVHGGKRKAHLFPPLGRASAPLWPMPQGDQESRGTVREDSRGGRLCIDGSAMTEVPLLRGCHALDTPRFCSCQEPSCFYSCTKTSRTHRVTTQPGHLADHLEIRESSIRKQGLAAGRQSQRRRTASFAPQNV